MCCNTNQTIGGAVAIDTGSSNSVACQTRSTSLCYIILSILEFINESDPALISLFLLEYASRFVEVY